MDHVETATLSRMVSPIEFCGSDPGPPPGYVTQTDRPDDAFVRAIFFLSCSDPNRLLPLTAGARSALGMSKLSITTWNINSVRLRIDRVIAFLEREAPDVLCLQETKCRDGEFPRAAFEKAGYGHMHLMGQKGLHGVATVSRRPVTELEAPSFCGQGHSRVIATRIDGTDIHNIYLPAGGDEPDPEINPKFAHKLDFLARMAASYEAFDKDIPLVVLGDLNVAPHEHDVWSHKQLLKIVSHTPVETDALAKVIAAGGFDDIARSAHAPDQKLYSWWSYRAKDWAKANRGRRLDHIWTNPAATPRVDRSSYRIHLDERGGFKPSDHAPVSVTLKS